MKLNRSLIAAALACLTLAGCLGGCAAIRATVNANPDLVAAGVIARERGIGGNCAGQNQAGGQVDARAVARLGYERIAADVTVLSNFNDRLLAAVNRARELTDNLCGRPTRPALTELPAEPPPVAAPG